MREVFDGLQKQGLHPFPLPVGVRLDEANRQQSPCIKCDTFDGFPCLVDARYDADTTCVRPALRHPNVTLLTNALVTGLDTDSSGRQVSAIQVARGAEVEQYSADIVVVACGAINSAALLLRSANDKHPRGLANSSDQVGRHYMAHNNSAILTVSASPTPASSRRPSASTTSIGAPMIASIRSDISRPWARPCPRSSQARCRICLAAG
jgi:choline dehydrogenase-like flavoprotein